MGTSDDRGDIPSIWDLALSPGIRRRSLITAIVVGTVLSLINHGDRIFGDGMVDLWKIALNYVVPYCVATYGGVTARMADLRHESD